MFTINCSGKLLTLDTPTVMGILNLTPDSFYKGYLYGDWQKKLEQMIEEGAQVIDVGGQSTRPGSERVGAAEERARILPAIRFITNRYPAIFVSVDTYQYEVAEAAVKEGAHIINDISGGQMDSKMLETVAKLGVPYILMHLQGTPETMQLHPQYENILQDMMQYFIKKIEACQQLAIKDIIVDPGFGFGKTAAQNFWILKNLAAFKMLGKPILAGISRKSSIYTTLSIPVEEAMNGSTVMHTIALLNGANILRVHDVKEALQAIALVEKYKKTAL